VTITLDHTIVHARDAAKTAEFLSEVLGLPPSRRLGHFTVVQVDDTSLDLLETLTRSYGSAGPGAENPNRLLNA
jgi:catechol 2,3-dioxygenase-like lactoylglutathione lyase family enzyme